ncbi:60S ribosomal export protein NMD3 [Pancytospora philotis]|nr:60S ribosomal export protein NMD3 [Pancytospora philotis]
MILCCSCGIEIEPCLHNKCERCLNNSIDLTASVMKSVIVETCKGCERYHTPPRTWKAFEWGSKDLLIFLLNRNKTLKKLNIIDSSFIYTERHSKKINIEILILEDGIEQPCRLEYSIRNKQCSECMRAEAKQYWRALVQVRQKPLHRRTFLYIEQLILCHRAHLKTSNIKERSDGIDFYFLNRADALELVDFLSNFFGTRTTHSHTLISEDVRNNTANKKFTFAVELLPFCIDDLVAVSDRSLGVGRYALVTKVGNSVVCYDPATGKSAKLYGKQYFGNRAQYQILMRSDQFKRYTVVYARPLPDGECEATITEDNVAFTEVITRLRLKDNDVVLGYNLANANLNAEIEMQTEVLLVRVFNEDQSEWTLHPQYMLDSEYKYFVEDVSKSKELLAKVAVHNPNKQLLDDMSNVQL